MIRARRQDPSAVRTKVKSPRRPARLQERRTLAKIGPRWSKEAMSLPEAASQSLAVLSSFAVRIRAPSGLNAPYQKLAISGSAKEAISLPEAASQSLAVVS